jgi:hypothetical protein
MCVHVLTEYQIILDGSHSVTGITCMEKVLHGQKTWMICPQMKGFSNYLHVKHEVGWCAPLWYNTVTWKLLVTPCLTTDSPYICRFHCFSVANISGMVISSCIFSCWLCSTDTEYDWEIRTDVEGNTHCLF